MVLAPAGAARAARVDVARTAGKLRVVVVRYNGAASVIEVPAALTRAEVAGLQRDLRARLTPAGTVA